MSTLHRNAAAFASVLVLGLASAGCAHKAIQAGDGPSPSPSAAASSPSSASAASFAGTWKGAWTRTSPPRGTGTYEWVLHQDGQQITGTLKAGNSACLTEGPLTGHADGRSVTLRAVTPAINGVGKAHAVYHGVLSGDRLQGTGIVTCSVGAGSATWHLTRQ